MYSGSSLMAAYACAAISGLATSLVHSAYYSTASRCLPLAFVPIANALSTCLINTGKGFSAYILNFFAGFLGGDMQSRFLVGIIIAIAITAIGTIIYVVKKPKLYD